MKRKIILLMMTALLSVGAWAENVFNTSTEMNWSIQQISPSVKLKVIHTPGHTADSVLFYDEQNHLAFVGDTIFKGSIGATHFPGGNFQQLKQSLLQKVFSLPEETVLYSGHSEATTIKQEKNQLL